MFAHSTIRDKDHVKEPSDEIWVRNPIHVQFYLQFKLRRPNCAKFEQLACERFFHTRKVKTDGNRSVELVI